MQINNFRRHGLILYPVLEYNLATGEVDMTDAVFAGTLGLFGSMGAIVVLAVAAAAVVAWLETRVDHGSEH